MNIKAYHVYSQNISLYTKTLSCYLSVYIIWKLDEIGPFINAADLPMCSMVLVSTSQTIAKRRGDAGHG